MPECGGRGRREGGAAPPPPPGSPAVERWGKEREGRGCVWNEGGGAECVWMCVGVSEGSEVVLG